MKFTLGKDEKLKSKILLEQLFAEGKHVKSFPFRLIYLQVTHTSEFPIKAAFSVPKRIVKLAVHRNRLKRLMREVYRKHKHVFAENLNQQFIFMFIYTTKEELKYKELELAMEKISSKFLNKIQENE